MIPITSNSGAICGARRPATRYWTFASILSDKSPELAALFLVPVYQQAVRRRVARWWQLPGEGLWLIPFISRSFHRAVSVGSTNFEKTYVRKRMLKWRTLRWLCQTFCLWAFAGSRIQTGAPQTL